MNNKLARGYVCRCRWARLGVHCELREWISYYTENCKVNDNELHHNTSSPINYTHADISYTHVACMRACIRACHCTYLRNRRYNCSLYTQVGACVYQGWGKVLVIALVLELKLSAHLLVLDNV